MAADVIYFRRHNTATIFLFGSRLAICFSWSRNISSSIPLRFIFSNNVYRKVLILRAIVFELFAK